MPHIHLETTADLSENAEVPDILEALTGRLAAFDSIPDYAIKSFHSLLSVWCVGDGGAPGFAHCEIAMLRGRSVEERREIAQAMMVIMREQFATSIEEGLVQVTLELREMDSETYMK